MVWLLLYKLGSHALVSPTELVTPKRKDPKGYPHWVWYTSGITGLSK